MIMNRRGFFYLCGIGLGGLIAGCGLNNGEPDYTVVISAAGMFNPAALVIPQGSTVAWHNRANRVHTVTADPAQAQIPERITLPDNVTPFDSGNLFAGERWVYRFDVPGTYIYFCRYHELEEMLGAITVTT